MSPFRLHALLPEGGKAFSSYREYLDATGEDALAKAFSMTPDAIVEEIAPQVREGDIVAIL